MWYAGLSLDYNPLEHLCDMLGLLIFSCNVHELMELLLWTRGMACMEDVCHLESVPHLKLTTCISLIVYTIGLIEEVAINSIISKIFNNISLWMFIVWTFKVKHCLNVQCKKWFDLSTALGHHFQSLQKLTFGNATKAYNITTLYIFVNHYYC